ncbi:MAG: hypothetical protein KDG52_17285 [Rhodocyclaceae bacterium]|nr:hypothetical protein [Rhodocyclaceae bacterium]
MALLQSASRVVVSSLIVAVGAAASIQALSQWAAQSAETESRLIELQSTLNAMNALEWRAISLRSLDEETTEAFEHERTRASTLLAATNAAGADANGELADGYERYAGAIARELTMIDQGRIDEALELDEAEVDPAFEHLAEGISAAAAERHAESDRVGKLAAFGTTASLLLAAAVIGWMFTRFTRSRERQTRQLADALNELQQTQAQLVQSAKLAALGQLIAGIAHEINSPLGAIRAAASNGEAAIGSTLDALPELSERADAATREQFFSMVSDALKSAPLVTSAERRPVLRALARKLDEAGIADARAVADLLVDIGVRAPFDRVLPLLRHPARDWLLKLAYDLTRLNENNRTILSAVERAAKVVFALKSYARVEHASDAQRFDLRATIDTVLELYRNQIKHGIELVCNFEDLPRLDGYPDELVQLWTNLVHNALHAMPAGGRLEIDVAKRGSEVVVSVTDSGPGIPDDVRNRIFEPFFSTKPRGEGTGLGLHICRQVVAKHQGRIEVDSRPGETRFRVALPLPASAVDAEPEPEALAA